jgi:hypothetical protein
MRARRDRRCQDTVPTAFFLMLYKHSGRVAPAAAVRMRLAGPLARHQPAPPPAAPPIRAGMQHAHAPAFEQLL